MPYRKIHYPTELKKAEQGKRVPASTIDFLISYVLEQYPPLQRRFHKLAAITPFR